MGTNPLTRGKKRKALDLLQKNRPDEGRALLEQVCRTDPHDAEAWYLLGAVNHSMGRLEKAAECLSRVIALQPNHAGAHYSLGSISQQLKRHEEALNSYRRAIAINPGYFEAYANLGSVYEALDKLEDAVQCYQQALRLAPDQPELHYNLGNVLQKLGSHEKAVEHYSRAIAIRPIYPQAHNNLGMALTALGHNDEAGESFRRAIAQQPDYFNAYCNLGKVLGLQNRLKEAASTYQKAIALKPDDADLFNSYGSILAQDEHFDDAAIAYNRALAIDPGHAWANYNIGVINEKRGRLDQAIQSYRCAIQFKPDHADSHWNLSMLLLLLGNFKEGWKEYEWRRRRQNRQYNYYHFPQPLWDGSNLTGRTILIHDEQGHGDAIQFIRYAPLVKQRGGTVVVLCLSRLARLFETIPGIDRIVPIGSELPSFDMHAPLLSLPRIFDTGLDNIPTNVPYLFPREISPSLKALLETAPPGKKRIGIVWAGNEKHGNDKNRSCTLSKFAAFTSVQQDVTWFSLQVGPRGLAHAEAPTDFPVVDLAPCLDDFHDTAAAIMQLDLVITVDTAVAHLAGALNKPVWILLPFVPDWRWMLERDDSPWYPSARLFRQTSAGDWDDVFQHITKELGHFGSTEQKR